MLETVNCPFAEGCHLCRCIDASTDETHEQDLLQHPGAICPDAHDERNGHAGQRKNQQHTHHADYGDHSQDATPNECDWEYSNPRSSAMRRCPSTPTGGGKTVSIAKLLQPRQLVHAQPVLDDPAVMDAHDVDVLKGDVRVPVAGMPANSAVLVPMKVFW